MFKQLPLSRGNAVEIVTPPISGYLFKIVLNIVYWIGSPLHLSSY